MMQVARYETPYHWWGPGPAPRVPPTLRDLLQDSTIDMECAATLWAALGQGRSLTVIGGPSGLGKSTLIHALLPALPETARHLYVRGCYETFAFGRDPRFEPSSTVLLINEISPHLPIYLWGPAVQRILEAGEAGCQILATAHARSVVEFAASLTGSPLRIPARSLATIELVALLEPVPDGAGRRVTELWQLSPSREGVSLQRLWPGDLPAGVSTDHVATARSAVQSLVSPENREPGAAASESNDGRNLPADLARAAADLEQTPAGE